jgi:single-stranded-DNA-specific exonuclease
MTKKILRYTPDLSQAQFSSNVHPRLQVIYAARGVLSDAPIQNKSLKDLLPYQQLKGIDQAVELLSKAVINQTRILIVGDFDADGATSCAVGMGLLKEMGAKHVDFLVPNRFEFGYGLTPEIVEIAKRKKPDLIITVDNGISSHAGVAAAKAAGIDVLITDHHLPAQELPEADAIVNPNQHGCPFPSKNLAGVGVIFYVLMALRIKLRELNWFENNKIAEPNLANYLDLVALGTVADVVPLDHNNRILVHQGLQRMRSGNARTGINALLRVAGRTLSRLTAADLGFAIGPRLNAAGRLDDMSFGIQCLLCEDENTAMMMAEQLNDFNNARKEIESDMRDQALNDLKKLHLDEGQLPFGLCLYDENWHQGVIGILASRIKDKWHRPVIAFANGNENEIKGSARSIKGFHIRDALDAVAAKHPELISKFGGHAMAAGLTIQKENYDAFCKAFDIETRRHLTEDDLHAVLHSDGELSADEMSFEVAKLIREGGPWGQHFPEPLFDGIFKLIDQRVIAEKHLKFIVSPLDNPQKRVEAIAFNADIAKWPLKSDQIHLAYRLDVNEYRGELSVQLLIEHWEAV